MTLEEYYNAVCTTPSDIRLDIPVLYEHAKQCKHITEFGTGHGLSATAFLYAQPDILTCYDVRFLPRAYELEEVSGGTKFSLIAKPDLEVEIEETDLLFIDTIHTYLQLSQELRMHGNKARKFLIFHDTVVYGKTGEDGTRPGLLYAINEFVKSSPWWRFKEHHVKHNGLLILERA